MEKALKPRDGTKRKAVRMMTTMMTKKKKTHRGDHDKSWLISYFYV